ncbi:MAG: hypothetical protein IT328_11965 [Caldilineaceae bacterium]|nr:hypothetical protein [Caldilineaceae bacterium]
MLQPAASDPGDSDRNEQRRWLTMRNLWLWLVPWGLFTRLCLNSIAPNDFWWHVRTGQLILQNRAIPVVDLFTYTQVGAPWINQAWIMQVILAQLMAWGGAPLVIFVHALLVAAGYTLILRACAPHYGVRTSVWATVIGVLIGIQSWAIRPQSFSFLAFGLLIFLIETHRHGNRRALWWAAPLFALWVNAHGVFVFGLAALGLYVVGNLWDALWARQWQARQGELLELCAQGLLAVAALAINPQGPLGILEYVLGFFQSKATIQYNMEFAPLTIRSADGIAFTLAILTLIVARLNSQTRLTSAQTMTLLAFAAMTLFSRRSAAWFGMVQIPVLALLLRGWWRAPWGLPPGKPAPIAALFGLLLLIAVMMLPWWRPQFPELMKARPLLTKTTPVEATAFLCETFTPGTRGFQAIAFASYMEAACPDLPVFIDSRFELYPTEQWDEYIDMLNGRYKWTTIADQYGMNYLFIHIDEQPHLVEAATANPTWREIYRDDRAIIFQRATPPTKRAGL